MDQKEEALREAASRPIVEAKAFEDISEMLGDALADGVRLFVEESKALALRVASDPDPGRVAHSLKGAAGSWGAGRVLALAARMDAHCKAGNVSEAVRLSAAASAALEEYAAEALKILDLRQIPSSECK